MIKKTFFIITLTLSLIIGSSVFCFGADQQLFSDVREDDWFLPQVAKLVALGAIDGYPDLTFKPDKLLTKSEFIKILVSSLINEEIVQTSSYWASGYIDVALRNNIIEEKDIKNLDLTISRVEMSKVISNMFQPLCNALKLTQMPVHELPVFVSLCVPKPEKK